jgi:hypothetical protein
MPFTFGDDSLHSTHESSKQPECRRAGAARVVRQGRGAMIWNQWTRSPAVTEDELRAAAEGITAGSAGLLHAEVADDAAWVTFTVAADGLDALVAALDPELQELDDDWEEEIDELEEGTEYRMVVLLRTDGDATSLTWDPKAGDNNASWSVAWLVATRLVRAVGATQTTLSARHLLEAGAPLDGAVRLPLFALRADAVLPTGRMHVFHVGRPASVAALRLAVSSHGSRCLAATQRDPATEHPTLDELHRIGCVAELIALHEYPDGTCNVFLRGLSRARLSTIDGGLVHAEVASSQPSGALVEERERLVRGAGALLPYLTMDSMPDDTLEVLGELPAERLGDGAAEIFASVPALLPPALRFDVLQSLSPAERATRVADAIDAMLATFAAMRESES